MEKYEEKLWGKIDFLHEKALSEHNKINSFSEIIIKYQTALNNFSKSIEGIKTLNSEIISETGNTLNLSLKNLQKAINSHIFEFKECSLHIKSTIIDPIIKIKDDKYTKEKEMYTQYNKLKTIYQTIKLNCEKAKKDYHSEANFCEKNIHNLIQFESDKLNTNIKKDEELLKIEEKMSTSITNTKNLEDKYNKIINEANNARIKYIKQEKELLQYYQKINFEFYYKINCVIIFIIPILKKMFSSLLSELISTEERCKKINIENDINSFINNNISNLSQEAPIIFEPYFPQAELKTSNISGNDKKELENLDINFHIIKILKKNFKDIRNDLNIEEEEKKFRLRFLCKEIFKIGPGKGFTTEEKEELIELLKIPQCKSFFLITLSKQRTKGRFKRSEKLVKELVEIIINILDSSEKIKDYQSTKNCIILSETFYYEKENKKEKNKKEENIEKIYLIDYIKYYKLFQNIDFWEGIIEYMIQDEIIKNEKINEKNKTNESPEDMKNKISNIGFSIVLSYTNTMNEFNISKENIIKIVETFVKKYNIEETFAQSIYDNVKDSPLPQINEENKKIFDDMFIKFEKNKEMIKSKEEIKNIENNEDIKENEINEKNESDIINEEKDKGKNKEKDKENDKESDKERDKEKINIWKMEDIMDDEINDNKIEENPNNEKEQNDKIEIEKKEENNHPVIENNSDLNDKTEDNK